MTRDDVLALVALGERGWVEIKESLADPQRIGETMSAVGNMAALADEPFGFVVWGFSADPVSEVGTRFDPTMRVGGEALKLHLARSLSPRVMVEWHEIAGASGRLVVAKIGRPRGEPLAFRGMRKCRVDSHNQALDDHPEIERLLWQALTARRTEEEFVLRSVHGSELGDLLDLETAGRLLRMEARAVPDFLLERRVLARPMPGRFDVTSMALIALARNFNGIPQIARHAPRVVLYSGSDRTAGVRDLTASRGIALGFQGLLKFVRESLPQSERYIAGRRVTRGAIPEIAIREIVMNALIHQDLGIAGAGPLIEVFKDRLEVSNPGRPLESDVRRLLDQPPLSRNEGLAGLMRLMGFAEERGSGIDKAIVELERAQLPAPLFEASEVSTRVTLFTERPFSTLSREDRIGTAYYHAVIHWTNGHTPIKNHTVRARFGLPDSAMPVVSRLLKSAVRLGWLRDYDDAGGGRSTSYVPFWA